MPTPLVHALGLVKQAAALGEQGSRRTRSARSRTRWRAPASRAWSTAANGTTNSRSSCGRPGSGTQSNMNANEVIASDRQRSGWVATAAARRRCIPNDHCQSRPILERRRFRPRCTSRSAREIDGHAAAGARPPAQGARREGDRVRIDIVKIGRTHTAGRHPGDARPGILRLRRCRWRTRHRARSRRPCRACYALAQGGTAVGTGLNAHPRIRRAHSRRKSPS